MSKAENKSSGKLKMLLASLLSLAVGGGAVYFYANNVANAGVDATAGSAQATVAPVAAAPVFLDLEPFTVTLNSDTRSRVLYLGVTVRYEDEVSRERTKRYMPVVRSRVLTELGDLDPAAVGDRETKDAIRKTLIEALTEPFPPEHQNQYVADILFTAYVVQ